MTKPDDLTAYIFDENAPPEAAPLAATLREWMDASPRFTAFVETYRDKIRKKVRVTRDGENALDLLSELEVAYRLLADRRMAVAYEPIASEKRRGPDFGVTYRTNRPLNIEVARLRAEPSLDAADRTPAETVARKAERVQRIVLDKLGQMQPGVPNLLVIHTLAWIAGAIDLAPLMHAVKVRAESKEPAFYAATRYANPAAFFKDYQRLSAILLWSAGPGNLWINKTSRPTPDAEMLRVVSRLAGS